MARRLSIRNVLDDLTGRLFTRAKHSHRSLERGLRHVLDESARPHCCALEKVVHVKSLVAQAEANRPLASPQLTRPGQRACEAGVKGLWQAPPTRARSRSKEGRG
jgi:plasmid stability protein